jgi:hypothetical protein
MQRSASRLDNQTESGGCSLNQPLLARRQGPGDEAVTRALTGCAHLQTPTTASFSSWSSVLHPNVGGNEHRGESATVADALYADPSLTVLNTKGLKKALLLICVGVGPLIYMFFAIETDGFNPLLVLPWLLPFALLGLGQVWKWTHGGKLWRYLRKPPPGFVSDFDGVLFRHMSYRTWVSLFGIIAGGAAFLLLCIMVSSHGLGGDFGIATYRILFAITLGPWFLVLTGGIMGVAWNNSDFQKALWTDSRASFQSNHSGASELIGQIERFAAKHCKQTFLQAAIAFLCANVCAGVCTYTAAILVASWWPLWATCVLALLVHVSCTVVFGMGMHLLLVVLPHEYKYCLTVARALSICTKEWHAAAFNLPYIRLDTPEAAWKWFSLRQLFVTQCFNACYTICSPAVGAFTIAAVGLNLAVVVGSLGFHIDLLAYKYLFLLVFAFVLSGLLVFLLQQMADIYSVQQQHLLLLADARLHTTFTATVSFQDGIQEDQPTQMQALLRSLEDKINGESFCPRIFGMAVKPTFFYTFVGYLGTSGFAVAAKALIPR